MFTKCSPCRPHRPSHNYSPSSGRRRVALDGFGRAAGLSCAGHQTLLAAASLNPQLVLVNLHMPHLDGAEVTRCLKQFDNPPVVFIVTSDDSIASRAEVAGAGAEAFLVKSNDLPGQLKSKLRECFGSNHNPRSGSEAVSARRSPNPAMPTSGSTR